MKSNISFQLNGKPATVTVDPNRKLLWVLRTDLKLTGTKYGCGEAYCGACTVHVDGEAIRSCAVTVGEISGKKVTTIEGLANGGALHPVQAAFAKHDALQCGYCTPGMIMNAAALIQKNPKATKKEIVEGMEENLCRCAAHTRIERRWKSWQHGRNHEEHEDRWDVLLTRRSRKKGGEQHRM